MPDNLAAVMVDFQSLLERIRRLEGTSGLDRALDALAAASVLKGRLSIWHAAEGRKP